MDEGELAPRRPFRLLNEPRRPLAVRSWVGAPWLAVAAVALGALMSQLDASVVTLAYPTIQEHFAVSVGAVTWVGLAYLLTVVATLVLFGRISDILGRKLIYVYGFAVFLLGSLACGLAPSFGALVAARVLQALGGSMIQANSVAIVVLSLPAASRVRGLGIQAAAQAAGLALGPTIGGLLLGVASWRWLFLLNVPVGLIALPAAISFIPRSRHLAPRSPLDLPGALLVGLAATGILGALSLGRVLGWTSPIILIALSAGLAAAGGLVLRERRTPHPLIDPELLRRPDVGRGLCLAGASFAVLFALLLLVPFTIERGLGHGPAIAGLALAGLPLAIVISSPFAGRAATRFGPTTARALAAGIGATGIGLAALGASSLGVLVAGLVLAGVGLGIFNTLNNAGVMAGIPPSQTAVGSATLNTTRGLGTAAGLAAGGALFVALGGADATGSASVAAFRASALVLAGVMVAVSLVEGVQVAARSQSGRATTT